VASCFFYRDIDLDQLLMSLRCPRKVDQTSFPLRQHASGGGAVEAIGAVIVALTQQLTVTVMKFLQLGDA
jgi:hypothetical protein